MLYAVESEAAMVEYARSKAVAADINLQLILGDMENFQLPVRQSLHSGGLCPRPCSDHRSKRVTSFEGIYSVVYNKYGTVGPIWSDCAMFQI